jgi:hypothetical protein
MKKILILLTISIFLSACKTTPDRETVYVDKPIPFYIVPKPPKVERPQFLYTQYSTPEKKKELKDNPGKAVRIATLSLKQYEEYIVILESVINKYDELADKSKNKLDQLNRNLNDMPLAIANTEQKSDSIQDYFIGNQQHLADMILTQDYFDKLQQQSKENIKNEKVE